MKLFKCERPSCN